MKVFKINEAYYIAAPTLEEAVAFYTNFCEMGGDDFFLDEGSPPRELTKEEMKTHKLYDIGTYKTMYSFRNGLNKLIKSGASKPDIFAVAE